MGTVERKLREREARRELILHAALETIAEQGIRATTIDRIAERAELGKGTIYYYFPSKEAILEALLAASIDQYFHGILARIAQSATPTDLAQAVVEQALRNHAANPPLFRFYFMLLADPSGAELLQRFSDRHLACMAELRTAIGARWGLSSSQAHRLADFFGTYVHGVLALAVAGRDAQRVGQAAIAALDAFLTEASGVNGNPKHAHSTKGGVR